MRICFVNEGNVERYAQTLEKPCFDEERTQLVLFSFDGLDEVAYEKELKGETNGFAVIAELSGRMQGVVVSGAITSTRGHKRKSAVVAEDGKLLGVSDMLHVLDGEVASGASLRVYETKLGKMGVVVGNDLFFPEVFKSLSLCGSDFIVCAYPYLQGIEQVLLRASAFSYGVPICFCGNGYCMLADSTGELVFASAESPVRMDFTPKKEYHLVETRRCGFIRSERKL